MSHLLVEARLVEQCGSGRAWDEPVDTVMLEDELVLGKVIRTDGPGIGTWETDSTTSTATATSIATSIARQPHHTNDNRCLDREKVTTVR